MKISKIENKIINDILAENNVKQSDFEIEETLLPATLASHLGHNTLMRGIEMEVLCDYILDVLAS